MSKILSDHYKLKEIRQGNISEVEGCQGLGVTLKFKENLSEEVIFELRSE